MVDGIGSENTRNLRTQSVIMMNMVEERGQPCRTPERAVKATEVVPIRRRKCRLSV